MASFESIFGALGTSQPSLTGSAEAETPGVGVSWSFGAQERDGVQSQTPSMAEEDGQGRYVLPHEEYLSDGHVEARLDEDFPLKPRTEPGAHGDEGDCGSECNSDVEQNNSEYEGDDDAEEDSVSEDEPSKDPAPKPIQLRPEDTDESLCRRPFCPIQPQDNGSSSPYRFR